MRFEITSTFFWKVKGKTPITRRNIELNKKGFCFPTV